MITSRPSHDSVLDRVRGGCPVEIYYPEPMRLQPAFIIYGKCEGSLPVSERLVRTVLRLPENPYLSIAESDQARSIVVSATISKA